MKSEPESVTSDDIKKEELIEPEKFSDVNEVRRAISLSNIWKVKTNFLCPMIRRLVNLFYLVANVTCRVRARSGATLPNLRCPASTSTFCKGTSSANF